MAHSLSLKRRSTFRSVTQLGRNRGHKFSFSIADCPGRPLSLGMLKRPRGRKDIAARYAERSRHDPKNGGSRTEEQYG